VALVEAAGALAGSSEATGFPVLVDGIDNPIDTRVPANGLMLRVNEDDLKVLVRGVLINPVRVQYAQVGTPAAYSLLGGSLE
jgi:hypothetical protein